MKRSGKVNAIHKYSTEEEIAAVVIPFMEADGWEVYQEVSAGTGSCRADIVGLRKGIVHVVEVKRTLSLDLMAQAAQWLKDAHYTSIAFPETLSERARYQKNRGREFAYGILGDLGIGILIISMDGTVQYVKKPRLQRSSDRWAKEYIIPFLHPDMKTWGNAGSRSDFYTPFRKTCSDLTEAVHAHPEGIKYRDAINIIKYTWHYASEQSGRSSLMAFLNTKVLPGIRAEKKGRNWVLYPKVEEDGES